MKELIEFQKLCPVIEFDKEASLGKGFKFKYASFPKIVKTIQPILESLNMGFYHSVMNGELTCVVFSENDKIISQIKLPASVEPKNLGAAITYYKRYTLCGLLGIVAEEDNDIQGTQQGKPKLNQAAFAKAIEKIQNGEQGILNKCLAHFELTEDQKEQLLNTEMQYNV